MTGIIFAIRTDHSPSGVNIPAPRDGSVAGTIHSHPWNSIDYWQNYVNRYPGGDDWAEADRLVAEGGANASTLSIYIVDGFGVTREFRYADRAFYASLSDSDKIQGAGLPDAVTGCGG